MSNPGVSTSLTRSDRRLAVAASVAAFSVTVVPNGNVLLPIAGMLGLAVMSSSY